jgi:hypothetical protein
MTWRAQIQILEYCDYNHRDYKDRPGVRVYIPAQPFVESMLLPLDMYPDLAGYKAGDRTHAMVDDITLGHHPTIEVEK